MQRVFLVHLCSKERSIPHEGREDIIEVMGDATGKNTDSLHLLGLVQLGLKFLFLLFRLLVFGDVREHHHSRQQFASTIVDRRGVHQFPPPRTVLAENAVLLILSYLPA